MSSKTKENINISTSKISYMIYMYKSRVHVMYDSTSSYRGKKRHEILNLVFTIRKDKQKSPQLRAARQKLYAYFYENT